MQRLVMFLIIGLAVSVPVPAQTFSSGSTGADGALDLSSGNLVVQLPDSGVLNYTTINIPAPRTLSFKANVRNTPVTLLVQGNVTIAGTINVSAVNIDPSGNPSRIPGPGGFYGGNYGQSGFGPGAGLSNPIAKDGRWIGPLSLVPIIGGSGGGGVTTLGVVGGGGGGAIVIASSTAIAIPYGGSIIAEGGTAELQYGGGAGSGGAIRLVANSISVAGQLAAEGGDGGDGVIRIEGPLNSLSFTGSAGPAAVLANINPTIGLTGTAAPSIAIASIGGFPVPTYSGQRFDTVDLLLPNQLTDPISMLVNATNIPPGTSVTVAFSGSTGATSTVGTLTGSSANSSANLQVTGLAHSAVTYLFVSATFDVSTLLAEYNVPGPNHVASVRLESAPGHQGQITFLRADQTVIDPSLLSKQWLEQFQR